LVSKTNLNTNLIGLRIPEKTKEFTNSLLASYYSPYLPINLHVGLYKIEKYDSTGLYPGIHLR